MLIFSFLNLHSPVDNCTAVTRTVSRHVNQEFILFVFKYSTENNRRLVNFNVEIHKPIRNLLKTYLFNSKNDNVDQQPETN